MRRLAPVALLALACVAGTARADTFAVLPAQSTPLVLPSFTTPNASGSLLLPASLSTPPRSPLELGYSQLLGIWQQAGSAYGIPWQVLAAINKVESNFGRNMGPSSAGAIGWMQFMPSTWLRWGTDANGDGVADPWNPHDAIYSAARYLAAAGGKSDLYRGVYAYNHADWYVREVLGLADTFGASGDGTIAFSLDRMQESLDDARCAVATAGDELVRAERAESRTARVVARLRARADRAALLSDRLDLQQRAGVKDAARSALADRVTRLQAKLAAAQRALVEAQQASAATSFAPGAAQVLSAPTYSGGYVFPVGGGPGQVSASHSHHDYPAVDIAAPEGAPLYALADSVVVNAWSAPDARCGIGFTIRAFDGQVWTYCHLSYKDPAVVKGASLKSGQSVGLVGSTGHATGPHLHLQLQPATSWPQRQQWFQDFAGSAFSWSDAAGPDDQPLPPARALQFSATAPAPSGPVFDVVQDDSQPGTVYFTRAGA